MAQRQVGLNQMAAPNNQNMALPAVMALKGGF
jgi:hypothetical protein